MGKKMKDEGLNGERTIKSDRCFRVEVRSRCQVFVIKLYKTINPDISPDNQSAWQYLQHH